MKKQSPDLDAIPDGLKCLPFVILVALTLLAAFSADAKDVVLASDGKAQARIVCETKHPVVKQAATDLVFYLGKITGADFSKSTGAVEIRILDAIPADAPPSLRHAPEGYWIAVEGNTIRIAGGSPMGTAYGVYHFLEEKTGVRWFLPAADGEYVPRQPVLKIPSGHWFSQPAFRMRWVGTGLWALRNGGNSAGAGSMIGPNGTEVTAGYRFEPGIYHTQEAFLPKKEYFASHPEYFALVKGKRQLFEKSTKLCTSNPALVRAVAGNMARYLDEHPGIEIISLSPTDGLGFCECDNCRALDEKFPKSSQAMSRRMAVFYNHVAAELRATHPQARLAVGAYSKYTWPPLDQSLNLLPEMDVILCHYGPACLAHPVNDPNCPANAEYHAIIRGWLARSSGVYFYEYYWKNNWFGLPWPIVHTIAADIPHFQRIGVKGVFSQFTGANAYTAGLNYYIANKLLWNPRADVHRLVNEYYKKYFAEAAVPMRDYYEMLEQRMQSTKADIPGGAAANGTKVYDSEFLRQLESKLDQALSLAKTDVTRTRILRHQKHIDYSRRLIAALEIRDGGNEREAWRQLNEIVEDFKKAPGAWEGLVSSTDAINFLGKEVARRNKKFAR